MTKKWYSTVTNKGSAHEQGLIIEEDTGNAIAVSYKAKNARLIAAAPELLKVLVTLLEDVEFAQPQIEAGLIGNRQIRKARELIDSLIPQE